MRQLVALTLLACALALCVVGGKVRAGAPVAELAYPVDGAQSRAWVVAAGLDGTNLRRLLPSSVHGWGSLRWSSDGTLLAAAPSTGSRFPSIKVASADGVKAVATAPRGWSW